jgi:hypothetical protein
MAAALELPAADELATKSWATSLFEKCHKACLLEMFVAGQGVSHTSLAHNDKRDAVGQSPLLVRVLVIEIEGAIQQFAGSRNDLTGGRGSQMEDEVAHSPPAFRFRQGIRYFHENPVGREKPGT